jgi:hypothetical protein
MTRGERLQAVYDLAWTRVCESAMPSNLATRALFGPATGADGTLDAQRTVLGALWEAAHAEILSIMDGTACGTCPPCEVGQPCVLNLADAVDAFKAGAYDAARREVLVA